MDSIESGTGKLIKAYKSNEFSSIKNIFTSNDVLYGKLRPYLKKYFKPHFSGLCSSEFWVLSSSKICQGFLCHFVSTDYFNNETNKTCGTKMPRADWKKISKLDIYYPNLNEQHKISYFLDRIDRKIDVVCSKIATLKKYRKGIQKKAFRRILNKEYVKLKSLVSFMPKSKLSAGNSIKNGKYPFYLSGEKSGTINSFMFKGCYIIANDGGEANFRLSNGPFSYSDHCICFQSENEWATRNLYEYLDSQKDRITYVGFLGSGLKNIDRAYLQNFRVPSIIRNKQLGILFSLLDEKIKNLENELVWLKTAKKYFLANMFI